MKTSEISLEEELKKIVLINVSLVLYGLLNNK